MEAALTTLVPRLLGEDQSFLVHPHQGKRDLLHKLPSRLRAYRRWLPQDYGLVVVTDEDRQNCEAIKETREAAALEADLVTRRRNRQAFQVVSWIAVEELEAWFLGDVDALEAAYPGTRRLVGRHRDFRDPDQVRGGTWEALERVLNRAGHHRGGLRKIEAARAISAHMEPQRNRSNSFRGFVRALLDTRRRGGG